MGLTGYLFRKIFITNLFYDILYEYGILLINAFFLEPFTNLRTFCIELRAVRTSQKCSKIAASERSLVFGTEVRTTLVCAANKDFVLDDITGLEAQGNTGKDTF